MYIYIRLTDILSCSNTFFCNMKKINKSQAIVKIQTFEGSNLKNSMFRQNLPNIHVHTYTEYFEFEFCFKNICF